HHSFSTLIHHPPNPTLFPYTTLFRSQAQDYNFDLQAQGSDPLTTTHSQPLTLHVLDYSFGAPPPLTLYPTTSGSTGFTVTPAARSEEHTSELQSLRHLVCRLLLEKKK